ncbi:MAG: NitT/TauT family transport system permease protein, partial [Alphaproteobacteria bacterium]|nr:NitT/TauT family transport system permease protein [Alphaproteobacteria bacterium]
MSATADITPLSAAPAATPAPRASAPSAHRLRAALLMFAFPLGVLVFWHLATYGRKYSLIPPPSEVAIELYDLAFGGIY